MVCVPAPIINDVENLRAHDTAQHDEDTEIPCLVGIDSLFCGIADADPESDQDASCDEQAIRGEKVATVMKELGVHDSLDAQGAIREILAGRACWRCVAEKFHRPM